MRFVGARRALHKATAGAGRPPFSPASLFAAGEVGLWYDPSDFSTMFQDTAGTVPVTATGQSVARINDKSGRGYHATQATAGSRPTLQQDAVGNYYLKFDGTDDHLITGAVAFNTDKMTVCAAVARDAMNASTGIVVETNPDFSAVNNSFFFGFTGNANSFRYVSRGTAHTTQNGPAAYPIGYNFTATMQTSISDNTVNLRVAGQQSALSTATQGGTGPYGTYPLFIGARSGGVLPTNGRIYGLVIRNALTDATTVANLERWLEAKCTAFLAPSVSVAPLDGGAQIFFTDIQAASTLYPFLSASSNNVYRSTDNVNFTKIASPTAGSPFVDTGLTNGTTYYYKVSSVAPSGAESALSASKSVVPAVQTGPTFDTDAAVLFARSGSAFGAQEKLAYHTAIRAMKGSGIWSGLSTFAAAGGDLTKTLLNWKNPAVDPTLSGSATLAANSSLTGDGTTGRLSLNVRVPLSDSSYMGFFAVGDQTYNGNDMGGGNSNIRLKSGTGGLSTIQGTGNTFTDPVDSTGLVLVGKPSSGWVQGAHEYNNYGIGFFNAGGRTDDGALLYALGGASNFSTRSQGAWVVGSGFIQDTPKFLAPIVKNFRNNLQNPVAASAGGTTSGLVANRTNEPFSSVSISVPYTFQSCHFASPQANVTKIAPIWVGWFRNADVYRNSMAGNITIEASVEYPAGSGTWTPLTFNSGSASGVVPSGGVLKADLLTIAIPAGAQFRIRTVVTAISSGTFVPCGGNLLSPSSTIYPDGRASGNLKTSGSISADTVANNIWRPTAIMGVLDAANCRGYVIHGDSIATGSGDTSLGAKGGTGFLQRALDPMYPWAALTTPGATEGSPLNNIPDMDKLRLLAAAMNSLGGVSHVITEGGTNDLSNGASLALISAVQRMYSSLWAGAKHIPCTFTPRSTSTDSWATTGNQTAFTGGSYASVMPAYNAAVRSNSLGDVDGFIDAATAASTGTDTSIWKAGYTSDGLHPNGTGHAAIAAAITIP